MARYPSQHSNTPFIWMLACALALSLLIGTQIKSEVDERQLAAS